MVLEVINADVIYQLLLRVYKMRIAVCDDEPHFLDSLKRAVYAYSNLYRLEIAIDEYYSGEALLDSSNEYDIVLLDYQMGGIDGLETARALRRNSLNCTIIFMTNFPHFVYESFEVNTFRFFEKPLVPEKLYKALDDYFEKFGNNYPLLLKVDRDTITVQTNDIVFLEADNKKCFIHLAAKTLHCAKTMGAVAELLPKNIFFRINKAFIVNFNFISKYDNDYICFKNGDRAHVSRKYLTAFKVAYRKFARGKIV